MKTGLVAATSLYRLAVAVTGAFVLTQTCIVPKQTLPERGGKSRPEGLTIGAPPRDNQECTRNRAATGGSG